MSDIPSPYDPGSKPPEASRAYMWAMDTIKILRGNIDELRRQLSEAIAALEAEKKLPLSAGMKLYALTIVDQANQIQELRKQLQFAQGFALTYNHRIDWPYTRQCAIDRINSQPDPLVADLVAIIDGLVKITPEKP